MDRTIPSQTVSASASASVVPISPSSHPEPMATPPMRPSEGAHGRTLSAGSLASSQTGHSRQEYMASLPVPSGEEIATISEIQRSREAEIKRRMRGQSRKSSDVDGASNPQPPSSGELTRPGLEHGRHRSSLSNFFNRSKSDAKGDERAQEDSKRDKAATLIQRTYRGYRTRREMQGLSLDATTRWMHAIREAQFRELNRPQAKGGDGEDPAVPGMGTGTSSAARRNWMKAGTIARRAGGDVDGPEDSSSSSSSSDSESSSEGEKQRRAEAKARRKKAAKTMGLQYFLEMVDLKHRYGSNLRVYHEEWQKTDTKENFFYWLDHGKGRFVDTEACPRERLDRERVRYLSREERQHYLVKVDDEGRLCWAKNGAPIDTTEKWKDSIHGIVPLDDPTPAYEPPPEERTHTLGDSSASENPDLGEGNPREEETEAARAAKYATPGLDNAPATKKVTRVSASTLFNKLLRKTVRQNTWIFVADTSFRLYVGLKASGAFQHSSFLQGSRISAAGTIKIKDGKLDSLAPLSGHYRPPASNFRAFVRSLKEEGVDMKHVSISKSYAILVGLETYVKTKNKGKRMLERVTDRKDRILSPEEVRQKEQAELDTSKSAARERDVIAEEEEEKKKRGGNSMGMQVMQRMGIHPKEPEGQKGEGNPEPGAENGETAVDQL